MLHLHTFYFIISLLVGISALSINSLIYLRSRYQLLKHFLMFYSAFTALVFLNLIIYYFRANIENYNTVYFDILDYMETPVSKFILMFLLPYFFHKLFNIQNARPRNIIIAVLSVTLTLAFPLNVYWEESNRFLFSVIELIEDIVFTVVFLYAVLLGFMNLKKINDSLLQRSLKPALIAMALFIPGIINDTFLSEHSYIRTYPVLFWFVSFMFTYYFVKNYLNSEKGGLTSNGLEFIPSDEFLNKYNISQREREVTLCLLKGKSYQDISKELFISVNTIKTHVRKIYPKFGVKSRHELVNLILRESGQK